jgi:prepilin-type N-terminal cleavage/methylation domain-containing protein
MNQLEQAFGVAPMTDSQRVQSQRAKQTRTSSGFTLIELLVGMTILGVILLAASGLLQGNQKATGDTQTRSNALGDARGAISRMTETMNQAAYIFPAGQTITVGGLTGNGTVNQVTTGRDAVAVLVSDGAIPPSYQGMIYYLANRAEPKFSADLPPYPTDRIAQHVLVEAQTKTNLSWPAKTIPSLNWGVDVSEGVLVDGIDVDSTADSPTHLMVDGILAPDTGSDGKVFETGLQTSSTPPPPLDTATALITTIRYRIGIRVATSGRSLADSGMTQLRGLANARNIPRR